MAYYITVRNTKTGTVDTKEFESAKLAQVYRDYHLHFGNWSGLGRWISASELTPESQKYVCDEVTKMEKGQVVPYYYVADGLIIESYKGSKDDEYAVFRLKRDSALKATDWTQLADVIMTQDERKSYRNYRDYLRKLPGLHDDTSIVTAQVYSYEEWLSGKR